MYQAVVSGLLLAVCTYTDLKCRSIYRRVVLAAFIFSMLGYGIQWISGQDIALAAAAAGLLPGAICFLISLVTREALGYGDSMVIAVCGISLGLESVVGILMTALFLASVWAIGLCIFRKAGRHQEFPFLPFLSMGYVIQMILA